MDKYEYKVRSEEIKELITQGDYVQAAELADTIDWRRVKSVMMLCTISDLYKINRRYEDARNMLLLAYERRPGGRTICYSLCELCIKTEEFVQAIKYYKEFQQAAPKDPGRYILQYKLYEAQDVSLEERIGVLEELKKRDYREKWAYELAYLYHRVGLETRCVEECDELILWFGEGKYVVKAMELKMLHQPLTPEQQDRYDRRFEKSKETQEYLPEPGPEGGYGEDQGYSPEGTYVESQEYGPEGTYGEDQGYGPEGAYGEDQQYGPEGTYGEDQQYGPEGTYGGEPVYGTENYYGENQGDSGDLSYYAAGESGQDSGEEPFTQSEAPVLREDSSERYTGEIPLTEDAEEMDIQVKTMDVGQYNTINLQAELAEGLKEILAEESAGKEQGEKAAGSETETGAEVLENSEVFFGETGNIDRMEGTLPPAADEAARSGAPVSGASVEKSIAGEKAAEAPVEESIAKSVMDQMRKESAARGEEQVMTAQPPKELAGVLSQEADGQISLVVPEDEAVEKQITGQMNIEDILAEWERMKQEGAAKRREEVRQRVLQHTGELFNEFEAAARDGLLEQLENEKMSASGRPGTSQNAAEEPLEYLEDILEEKAVEAGKASEGEAAQTDKALKGGFVKSKETLKETEKSLEESVEGMEEEIGEDFEEEAPEYMEEVLEENYEDLEDTLGDEFPETGKASEGKSAKTGEVLEDGFAESEEFLKEEGKSSEGFAESIEEDGEEVFEEEVLEYMEEPFEEDYEEDVEDTREELPDVSGKDSSETPGEPVNASKKDKTAEKGSGGKSLRNKKKASREEKEQGKPEETEAVAGAEAETDEQSGDPVKEDASAEREKAKVRALTHEEKELFAPFIQNRSGREKLVKAIDNISLAAYTGNIIVTGEEGMDTITLAKNMIREVQITDSNFSGKVAKITGQGLTAQKVPETLKKVRSGALIIEKASGMDTAAIEALHQGLQQDSLGVIVLMEDTRRAMNKMLEAHPALAESFTARMDLEPLSNDKLVAFGKHYAREMEYSIDDMGALALHTRIEERQTIDHVVTVMEVKQIVDEAIHHASRKNIGHFLDILFAKRYDEEDMIILTEKDFA